MADDDKTLTDYLRDFNEAARYYLGPHAYKGLQSIGELANFFGPQADVAGAVESSQATMESARKGDIPGTLTNAAYTALSPAGLLIPGTVQGYRSTIQDALAKLPQETGTDSQTAKNIVKYLREQNIPDPKTGRYPADKPVRGEFMTEHGSTYEWYDDATTQRYRAAHKPNDPAVGLQPVSHKTVFADPEDVKLIGGMFQNPEMATRLDPIFDDAGNIEGISLRYLEDYGPRKAGETIQNIRVKIYPEVGKTPIEISDHISPKGSHGRVHFGTRIVEVQSVPKGLSSLLPESTDINPIRRLVENLPQKVQADLPKQPGSKSSVYGYHGTVGQREGDEFFDINFARPQDQFLGEGFYFTIDPKVAEEYANIRAIKDLTHIPPSVASRAGFPRGAMRTPQGNIVTTDSIMKGMDVEGNPILAGQNIARFDLGGIKKPYIVKSNKDRLWAKENINKLKEDGYDSILFDDLQDRSKQIMVFPEYIDKIKSMRTGGLVQRNPYNYKPRTI